MAHAVGSRNQRVPTRAWKRSGHHRQRSGHRDGPTARPVHRSAVHDLQSHHGDSSRRTRARNLANAVHSPVLIGSDDHDFEEARSAHFLTKNHESLTLRYEPLANVDGLPMFRVPIEDSLHEFVDRAADSTPGSEFRSEIAAALHESLRSAESLSDWAARVLARLFRDTNFVFFSPHLPASRALAAEVLEKEIAVPLTSTRLLNETGDRLDALGFPRQITKADTECGFFLEVESATAQSALRGKSLSHPRSRTRLFQRGHAPDRQDILQTASVPTSRCDV